MTNFVCIVSPQVFPFMFLSRAMLFLIPISPCLSDCTSSPVVTFGNVDRPGETQHRSIFTANRVPCRKVVLVSVTVSTAVDGRQESLNEYMGIPIYARTRSYSDMVAKIITAAREKCIRRAVCVTPCDIHGCSFQPSPVPQTPRISYL